MDYLGTIVGIVHCDYGRPLVWVRPRREHELRTAQWARKYAAPRIGDAVSVTVVGSISYAK